jgi:hypothetical protein
VKVCRAGQGPTFINLGGYVMERREFLVRVGSVVLLIPASRFLVGCSSSDETGGPPSLTFTSSSDPANGHSHRVSLEVAIIENPPAAGTQPRTTEAAGHVHTVILTEADLLAIRDNQTVTTTTSADAGHTHTFTFRRSAGTPTGGGGDYDRPGGY